MEWLLEWVKNLAVCMILIAAILRMLPRSHFEKYVRFYTGLLVLLLIIRPVFQLLSLENPFEDAFSRFSEYLDDEKMEEKLKEMEEKKEAGVANLLEEEAADRAESYAAQEGMHVTDCSIFYEADPSMESYGQITGVELILKENREAGDIVEPVVIMGHQIRLGEEKGEEATEAESQKSGADQEAVEKIREEMAELFLLDREKVTVRVES